jgi:hypothetical protein
MVIFLSLYVYGLLSIYTAKRIEKQSKSAINMREMLTFKQFVDLSEGLKLPPMPSLPSPKLPTLPKLPHPAMPKLPAPKLPTLPKLPAAPTISLPKTKGAYPSTMNPMARARALRAKKKGELVHAVKQAKLLSLRTKLAQGK